ncbi:SRPBCC family protein [Plantactinospora sp. CA-290183]|uniref:SRPBCC family protein n=1 Tax=Plantactinospora sp. CA-290183 TaxID=3240006 RepID=UPI003D8D3169
MASRVRWLMVGVAGVAGVAGAGALVARRRAKESLPVRRGDGYATERALTVDRPVGLVRALFRDPEQLSAVLDRPVTAERLGESRWRCVVHGGPDGAGRVAMATAEERDGSIRWRVEEGPTAHEGHLRLVPAPGDRGTEIRVELSYPGGRLRHRASMLRGQDPDQVLRTALRRAKSVLECGRVISTMHEPSGRGAAAERLTRAVREKLTTGGRP